MRFIAIARFSCASRLMEPRDMAPVLKRLTISRAGSTSSRGIDFEERNFKRPAKGGHVAALVVHDLGVLLEELVAAGADGVLQQGDRVRVVHVELAAPPPLILAAGIQIPVELGGDLVGMPVARRALGGDRVEADALDARGRAGEVAVDELAVEADRLEDLRAAIALQGRDPHLGHDLEDPLVGGLEVLRRRLRPRRRPSGTRCGRAPSPSRSRGRD